jgi:glycosyltransferase involved in cell wall biosynthesis
MRICVYTESALPLVGGQELVVDQLAREFLNFGHEVVVLAPRPRGVAVGGDTGLPYAVVRHPRFVSTYRFARFYSRYLARLRNRFPFDVLHCHSVQPTGHVAACSKIRNSFPTVITSHCGDICPESRHFTKPGAIHRCRLALQRADAAVAITNFVEQRLRTLSPDIKKLVKIPNGVDYFRFGSQVRRIIGINQDLLRYGFFLFIGRMVSRKGVDLLLHAFKTASAETRAGVVIAGTGPEAEAMKLLAKELGIAHRAQFIGHVAGDDKIWLLQNAIATVIPSRISEGFPLVLLESYAAGRPVIANRIRGLEELVTNNHTGFLVPPDSANCLSRALLTAAGCPANTNRLGETAKAFAAQYEWTAIARRYIELFQELLVESP